MVSQYVNPLASAYQRLGLKQESIALIESHLTDRTIGPEADTGETAAPFNVHDVKSKDKAAYTLLVRAAAADQDWTCAIGALRNMTEAGLYPSSRNINSWVEACDKRDMPSRSWKERREEFWVESLQSTIQPLTDEELASTKQKGEAWSGDEGTVTGETNGVLATDGDGDDGSSDNATDKEHETEMVSDDASTLKTVALPEDASTKETVTTTTTNRQSA